MTEREVALELEHALRRAGADGLSFESIVAFGEHAAEPHHHPTHRALEVGDVMKMDFGALDGGYHADMTRTIALRRAAARAAEGLRRRAPGTADGDRCRACGHDGGAVDAVAREVVDGAGYGAFFTHGLGHGVGLDIHEGPNFRRGGDESCPPARS